MNDDDDEPVRDSPQPTDQQALALSGALQLQFLGILNGGGWSECPHVVAHAVAELLGQVLRACVMRDQKDTPWTMDLIDRVREFVLAATINPQSEPGATRH